MSEVIPMRRAAADSAATPKFWPKVNKDGPIPAARPDLGPCWLWLAATNGSNGYGIFRGGQGRDKFGSKRWILAHRFAYEILAGPIPQGLHIDHLCFNRLCVNPKHMETVTQRVNTLRSDGPSARQARRNTCIRGHEFDVVDKAGKRRCSVCDRAKELRRYERRYGRRPKSRGVAA
jgi:hypothetical protein